MSGYMISRLDKGPVGREMHSYLVLFGIFKELFYSFPTQLANNDLMIPVIPGYTFCTKEDLTCKGPF